MSTRKPLLTVAAVLLCFPVTGSAQPCPGQGSASLVVVSAAPPAPGGRITLRLQGAPSRPFVIAADIGPGPVFRPRVGTICLDLGPQLHVLANGFPTGSPVLDANGLFSLDLFLPARPALDGRTIFLQGIVRDPSAPNGFAVSPRLDLALERAVIEDFGTIAFRDAAATTASWPGDGLASAVAGASRNVDVAPADTGFLLDDPLVRTGSRFQMLYAAGEIGAQPGESIVGMAWGPRSNFVFATTYASMKASLGHARAPGISLGLAFDANFGDAPTRVFAGDYALPNELNALWFPWPQFETDFAFDGSRNLVFEVDVPPGASTFQLFRANSVAADPRRRVIGASGAAVASSGERTVYHTRFRLTRVHSIAQSLFYDTGIDDPDYSSVAVRTASLPPGSEAVIEVEGAEDANHDGVPDPGSLTGFRSDPDEIDGSRLVRFRLRLKVNAAGDPARVTSVAIAFH